MAANQTAPTNLQRWQSLTRRFERSPVRAPIAVLSVSRLSQSQSTPIISADYIERVVDPTVELQDMVLQPYNLSNILGVYHSDFGVAEEALCDKLKAVILHGTGHSVDVRKDSMMFIPHVHTIPTSVVKIPDGSILDNGATIFIFELESNSNWWNTTLKLAVQLAQMLASLRNRAGPSIDTIVGFYIPFKSLQCVVEVQVKWSDSALKFVETHSYVEMIDVNTRLTAIYSQNKGYWDNSRWDITMNVFNYPVTPTYVENNFGVGAMQIQSGDSIVIVSSGREFVYKKPMNNGEEKRLMFLLFVQHTPHPNIGFPNDVLRIDDNVFFRFDEYFPPATVPMIHEKCVWYIRSLVNLVMSLHERNLAHLDIRRENICISRTRDELVLIDLDRSCEATGEAILYKHKYCTNPKINIKIPVNWTNAQLDWAQVGLLLQTLYPDLGKTDAFILKLLNDGEI